MKKAIPFYLTVCLLVIITGCFETDVNFDQIRDSRGYSLEIANDVKVLYSDSSILKVSVEGPLLKRFIYKFRVDEEFPEGVHVEFYDDGVNPTAWLDAKYALRQPNEKRIICRDSVVLYNQNGARIESSEFIWNEREHLLTTDRFVQIIRPPGDTIYSYGLRSNETFTDYTLYSVEGDVVFEDFDSSYE